MTEEEWRHEMLRNMQLIANSLDTLALATLQALPAIMAPNTEENLQKANHASVTMRDAHMGQAAHIEKHDYD